MAARSLLVLLLALFALSIVSCEENVINLTDGDFDSKISTGAWMVEFYAPWCGHCKRLAPTWEEFATEVKGKINVAKVDCTIEKNLASRFGIRGFPTIKFFTNGHVYDYQSARTLDAFKKFATEDYLSKDGKELPEAAAAEVKAPAVDTPAAPRLVGNDADVQDLTDSTFDAAIASGGAYLIEFFAPWCGHCKRLAPTWAELATTAKGKFHVAKVDCTANTAVCTKFGVRGYPTIKFVKEGKVYDYRGDRVVNSFIQFAEGGFSSTSGSPLPAGDNAKKSEPEQPKQTTESGSGSDVVTLTTKDFDSKISYGGWLVEFYAPWCGHCKRLAPIWEQLATANKGKVSVGKVDCTIEKELCGKFGVKGYPTVKFLNEGKVYEYNGDRSVAAFSAFATTGFHAENGAALPAGNHKGHDEL